MPDFTRAELKYLVERQREEIQALNEVGKLLSSTIDPQEITQMAASYLQRAFPVALCGILVLPQKKLHVIPLAPIAQVEIVNAIKQTREAASQLLHRAVPEEESVSTVEEVRSGGWMQATTSLRSHLFVPLMVKGQPIGILSLFSGQTEAFTKEDHHAVGIVAEQLGWSLRNAFLLEELRQADELKNQMLSIVSHELNTPLTTIKGGVDLVMDGSLGAITSEQHDFLKTVIENAERLEQIIQKVRTSTEIMTGQVRFAAESLDLRILLATVEKTYRSMASSKGVQVKIVDYPKPLFWPVDKAHLEVALDQLVENAIQATAKGGFVTLKLAATATEAEIQVLDTGCGIAKDALPTLFDRFKSIGDINNRKMGGLGQGLFIAKSLIEGQGGTITVESIVGEGTRLTVTLPKQTKTATPP